MQRKKPTTLLLSNKGSPGARVSAPMDPLPPPTRFPLLFLLPLSYAVSEVSWQPGPVPVQHLLLVMGNPSPLHPAEVPGPGISYSSQAVSLVTSVVPQHGCDGASLGGRPSSDGSRKQGLQTDFVSQP